MPTLKDIAAACGVSVITVSDVLNGKAGAAGKDTRERVLDAARRLDYRPHAVARSLRRRRTNILGFYGGYGYTPARSLFAGEIAAGLQDGCEENRKDLLTHGTFRGRSVDDIYNEIAGGQIDGLVLLAPPSDPLAARLAGSALPVVAIVDAVAGIPSVVADDARAGRLLARYLRGAGHERVLYFTSSRAHVSAARRLRAFQEEGQLTLTTVAVDWQGGLDGERPDAPPFALAELLLSSPAPPTVAVCWNDFTAYRLLSECARLGVRVPQDLAVAGYDGIVPQVLPARTVTSVRLPWAQAAQTAVSLLVSLIDKQDVAAETVLPVTLVTGDTA